MTRIFIIYILPALAPTALYLIWLAIARRRADASGATSPVFGEGPLAWALLAWLVILIAGLIYWNLSTERFASGTMVPPRLIDGKIVPAGPREPVATTGR